jgi:Phospholipase_D-nuclease N-terminal
MLIAADYPFLEVFWTMIIFFVWVSWFWMLIGIIGDVFSRRDIGGGKKTGWLLFLLFVPFIGVFAYLIANSNEMADRRAARALPEYERRDYPDTSVPSPGVGGAPAHTDRT